MKKLVLEINCCLDCPYRVWDHYPRKYICVHDGMPKEKEKMEHDWMSKIHSHCPLEDA